MAPSPALAVPCLTLSIVNFNQVTVRGGKASSVHEGGKPLAEGTDVKFVRMEGDRAVLTIGSGSYRFMSPGAMRTATTAFRTAEPVDQSTNPDNVDLADAQVVATWDFSKDADIARWARRNHLNVARRDGKTLTCAVAPRIRPEPEGASRIRPASRHPRPENRTSAGRPAVGGPPSAVRRSQGSRKSERQSLRIRASSSRDEASLLA